MQDHSVSTPSDDFADVWHKKQKITVPELSASMKAEPLEIRPIPLGFDKSERKGPER